MFGDRKILPFVGMVVSVLYFIYVVSLGSSTMIGDEIGGDPGGMFLPLVLSIFLFVGTTILFLTDKKKGDHDSKRMDADMRRLFLLTICVTLLYVVLARPVGYLLTTLALVYTLTYFYLRGDVRKADLTAWIIGLLVSAAFLIALYTIGRRLTRFLLLAGRRGTIPAFFGSTGAVVAITLVVVTALFLLANFLVRRYTGERFKKQPAKEAFTALLISVATTELIYLIFRQLFLVELVRGIIRW